MIKLMFSLMQLAFLPTKDVEANIQELAFVILMFVNDKFNLHKNESAFK